MIRRTRGLLAAASVCWVFSPPLGVFAADASISETGSVVGQVRDPKREPLLDAVVEVEGTTLSTTTDSSGFFRLSRVPIGEVVLIVSYLGYRDQRVTIPLEARETARSNVTLAFGDAVTVRSSPLLTGQAKALNRQKTAVQILNVVSDEQIGRFPDRNAAEAAQRIPGTTLQRSHGEGRYVVVRSAEARFNPVTVNGERVPSPEGEGGRRVPLDVIPAGLLEAIEVAKALTPEMDGDAIGGAVNLVTRRAPETPYLTATVAGGYRDLAEDASAGAELAFGRRFGADHQLGLLLGGSSFDTGRGSDNIEPEYDDGFIDTLELRQYALERQRVGWIGSLDYRISDRSDFFLRGIRSEFVDDELRRRKRERVGRNRIERSLRYRPRTQTIASTSMGGSRLLASRLLIETRLAWGRAQEEVRNRFDSTFTQRNVDFNPNVSPDFIDPGNIRANPSNEDFSRFFLSDLGTTSSFAEEEDVAGGVDVTVPFYRNESQSGYWKAGVKIRSKDKRQGTDRFRFEFEGISLADVVGGFGPAGSFFGGRYEIGPFPGLEAVRRLADGRARKKDFRDDLEDFETEEQTSAAYGMVELQRRNLTFLGGFRWERTETASLAFVLVEGTDLLSPVASDGSYQELLPMFHLRYRLGRDSNLRAALTRTLARPNFDDLAPTLFENEEDQERERGNPDLEVTRAWNADLLYERFLEPAGVLSAGVFFKRLGDNIFDARFEEVEDGVVYDVSQPQNGESAEILGLELAFQNRFARLPEPWDGLGIYFNYTYSDSAAEFFSGRPGTRLPGQAEHVGNLALSYEKGPFSGLLSLNYHSGYIREIGGSPDRDTFEARHLQLDFSASQRLSNRLQVFVELVNSNDEPLRRYEGSSDRPIQEELYGWWANAGLKWSL